MDSIFRNLSSLIFMIMTLLLLTTSVIAAEKDDEDGEEEENELAETYQNPFEEISENNITEFSDFLSIRTTLEFEKEKIEQNFFGNLNKKPLVPSTRLLELEIEIDLPQNYSFNITLQDETQGKIATSGTDEYELKLELNGFEITAGRFDLPFTEFHSYFISDTLVEFAEPNSEAVMFSYENDNLQTALILLQSKVTSISNESKYDYAYNINFLSDDQRFMIGFGFLSDLAESDEQFLEDFNNQYKNRISAVTTQIFYAWQNLEIYGEMVRADDAFFELDKTSNRPVASNFEIAWYPRYDLQIALRYETSEELEDAPKRQKGIAIAWRPLNQIELAVELLQADFKKNFVLDNNDIALETSEQIVGQFTFEF